MRRILTESQIWLNEKSNKNKIKSTVQIFLYEMYMQKNDVVNTLQLRDFMDEHIRLEESLYDDMLKYIQLLTPEEITDLVVRQAKIVIRREKNRERDKERAKRRFENLPEEEKNKLREYWRNYNKEYKRRRREKRYKVEPDGMRITAT